MTHQEVCDTARRIVNRFVRENIFSDIETHEEDRHDGKNTLVLSFMPSKGTEANA